MKIYKVTVYSKQTCIIEADSKSQAITKAIENGAEWTTGITKQTAELYE